METLPAEQCPWKLLGLQGYRTLSVQFFVKALGMQMKFKLGYVHIPTSICINIWDIYLSYMPYIVGIFLISLALSKSNLLAFHNCTAEMLKNEMRPPLREESPKKWIVRPPFPLRSTATHANWPQASGQTLICIYVHI